ncbi:PAS domain S-box protein [Longibacter salinarum]|nr:PAS domain S-box protein [Longibacter salinarum]
MEESVLSVSRVLRRWSLPEPCYYPRQSKREAVFILDSNRCFSHVEPEASHLLGRPIEMLVGTPSSEVPILASPGFASACDRAQDGEPAGVDVSSPSGVRQLHLRLYPAGEGIAIYSRRCVDAWSSLPRRVEDESFALDNEEVHLKMAIDGADLGAWEVYFETGRAVYTERWAEILGYTLDEVENHADFFFDHVHPADQPRVRKAIESCIERETEMMDITIRMRHKDGAWRWVVDRGRIVKRAPDGSPLLMVGTHMDVTEAHRAQRNLRRERDLLQRIFDASPAAIIVFNAEGDLVRVSERAKEVLGIAPRVVDNVAYNDPFWEIRDVDGNRIPDEDLPFARVMRMGQSVYDLEHTITRSDGSERLLSINGAPLFDEPVDERGWIDRSDSVASRQTQTVGSTQYSNEPTRAVFVLEDITEKRRMETALRRSEERFRAVVEQAVDVVAIIDPDATFTYLSPSIERVTGYPRAHLLGRNGLAIVHPEDVSRFEAAFENALLDSSQTVDVEGRYRHQNGEWRYLSIRGRQILSESGRQQILANMRDTTEEQQRREALVAAKELAEKNSRLKSAMLANISHEIRTPLTSIIGFSEILSSAGLPAPLDKFSRHIERSGNRLLQTLDAILDLSKLEAGVVDPHVESVRLRHVAEEVAGDLQPQAQAGEIDLRAQCESVQMETDPGLLYRTLVNLAANAIKFTEPGGKITIRGRQTRPVDGNHANTDPNEASVLITVEDTGVGMDSGFLTRAFDAFEQESTGTARHFEGSGLGLALVQKYVSLLEGTVWIESEKGEGTTVFIRLPKRMS